MKAKRTFAGKIVALLLAIIFITIVLFTGFTFFVIKDSMTKQMENDGQVLINTIKREIENYDVTSFNEINKVFAETKKSSNGGIAYISLSNPKGEILVTDEAVYSEDVVSGASENVAEETKENSSAEKDLVVTVNGDEAVYNISEMLSNESGILNVGLSMKSVEEGISRALFLIVIISIIIIAGAIFIGIIVSRLLVRDLKLTMKNLDVLSLGDLTASFQTRSQDEFGRLDQMLMRFTDTLRNTVGKTMKAIEDFEVITKKLDSTTNQVSESTSDVNDRALEISSILNEQLTSIESLQSTFMNFRSLLLEMAENVDTVKKGNNAILHTSEEGNLQLTSLIQAIDEVEGSFVEGSNRIQKLHRNVETITEITEVINAVAEQTNLLSLNAAIEAARAGEAGKGFGIVADEIKKLAEQVINSSKNINSSISLMKSIVSDVTQGNDEIADKISKQKLFIDHTVVSFEKIKNQVDGGLKYFEDLTLTFDHMNENQEFIVKELDVVSRVASDAKNSGSKIQESINNQKEKVTDIEHVSTSIIEISEQLQESISSFKVK